MGIKTALFLGIFIFCSVICLGQKANVKPADERLRIKLAKQSAVDNFEVEISNVSYPAVRSFVRFQIASWLWKEGKDDTGYAPKLAVKAFEELAASEGENSGRCSSDLCAKILALLELHSPETKKKLAEKYKLDSLAELDSAFSLLEQKNGEKLVADKIIRSFETDADLPSQTGSLIEKLAARNSPELLRALEALLNASERGRAQYSTESLFELADTFRNPLIPVVLRNRFYFMVVKTCYAVLNSEDEDLNSAYNLIYAISGDIPPTSVELFNQVELLKSSLKVRIYQGGKEYEEAFERIESSSDKLKATLSEAEATDNKALKESLYIDAENLALRNKKLQIALDVIEKLIEIRKQNDKKDDKREQLWYDQCFRDVALQALKENNVDINKIATGKINDSLMRADVLRRTAIYFYDNKRLFSASETLKETLKITNEAENNSRKISILLQLIPAYQKIDKDQIFEITRITAKTIDAVPSLNVEDKPESENYRKYVNSAIAIDISLLSTFSEFLKLNKMEAINFSNRINKKEFKIITSYALMTDGLRSVPLYLAEK